MRKGFSPGSQSLRGAGGSWGQQPDEDRRGIHAGLAECSPDLYHLKGPGGRQLSSFPACRGAQLGGLLGQGLREGGKLGVLTGFFIFISRHRV